MLEIFCAWGEYLEKGEVGCFKDFSVTTPLVYKYAKIWKHFYKKIAFYSYLYRYWYLKHIFIQNLFESNPRGAAPPGPPICIRRSLYKRTVVPIFICWKFSIYVLVRGLANFKHNCFKFFVHEGSIRKKDGGLFQKFFRHNSISI